jgi:hypothetical protein
MEEEGGQARFVRSTLRAVPANRACPPFPLELAGRWRRLLSGAASEEELNEFREHERTGRVLGDEEFQERLEKQLGRVLRRQTPGPKKASKR